MHYLVKFYVGAEQDKDGHALEASFENIRTSVQEVTMETFGGGTIYEGRGFWKSLEGRLAVERCLVSEHVADPDDFDNPWSPDDPLAGLKQKIDETANVLRKLLGQDSVLITIQELHLAEFVSA